MTLTNEQLRQLRISLEEEIGEIRSRLDGSDGYGLEDSLRVQTGELSPVDNHPGDLGSETFERGKDLALRDADSLRLNDIDDALERMEDGTYGVCDNCGKEIPFARLQAQPAAKHCIECQEHEDFVEISANRPVEENFLYPGFGRTFLDPNDQTGFDGEDAWQKVAAYGPAVGNDDNPYSTERNHMYIDAEERLGYVEDIEGFLITDLAGNPVEPGFVRNEAYRRYMDNTEPDETL